MRAKYAVPVTNYVTGFSLQHTKENGYSVAGSSHQDGKADAVADFIASCKKCGVKPRLYFYYSTSCNGYYGIDHAKTCDYRSSD